MVTQKYATTTIPRTTPPIMPRPQVSGTSPNTPPEVSPEISIVIPVMNEAGNIHPLINGLRTVFANRAIEIIYVNDASDDTTLAELEEAMKTITPPLQLRILTHNHRAGQSAALRSAIRTAHAQVIATLDGDGQNLPKDMVRLEKTYRQAKGRKASKNMVMVVGMRQNRQDNWLKLVASRIATGARKWVLGDPHSDSGCGLKFFDKELFCRLPYFDHMHRFMPVLALREGAEVIGVPIGHAPRKHGQSKYTIRHRLGVGVIDIIGVWWLVRRSPKRLVASEVAINTKDKAKNRPKKIQGQA